MDHALWIQRLDFDFDRGQHSLSAAIVQQTGKRSLLFQRAIWLGQSAFVFASVAVTGILANLIKNTIGRARPKHFDTLGAHAFDFGAFQSSFASFPSGHSTTFGALCMGIALLYPKTRWICFFMAFLGGTSRVVVGAHYPSDVIAGLAFGAGLTWIFARWLAQRNALFRFGKDGRLSAIRRN